MRVLIDECYLDKVIKGPEDLLKVLSVPPVHSIVALCCKPNYSYRSYTEYLPKSWLSDKLFYQIIEHCNENDRFNTVKRFVEFGRLPKLTEEQKLKLVDSTEEALRFFPELGYDVWLEHYNGIDHSDLVPADYRTQDMLLKLMANGAKIAPDLLTNSLIDSYIAMYETLTHIPNDRITLERLKKVLSKHVHMEKISEEQMKGIVVDEELAGYLSGTASNFEFIPDVYRTRDRVSTIIANESKRVQMSFWNTCIPPFLKKKGWLTNKFYLEVLAKSGDNGVKAIIGINEELVRYPEKSKLDIVALVQAYPAAIKYVNKTDQTKLMADAVLASERAMELKEFLSMKFITKKTSPLFLSSENKDVVDKVERVLTEVSKRSPVPPPYTIEPGKEVEIELTEGEVSRLGTFGIPFII